MADRERRALIQTRDDNYGLKNQIFRLIKENEMLQLRNSSHIKVPEKMAVTSCSSDFIWRFMRLVADGSRVQEGNLTELAIEKLASLFCFELTW